MNNEYLLRWINAGEFIKWVEQKRILAVHYFYERVPDRSNPLELYFRDCSDNLQYLFWRDNLSKNRYLTKDLFQSFNQTQIFILSIASKRHKYCPDSDIWIKEAGFDCLLS